MGRRALRWLATGAVVAGTSEAAAWAIGALLQKRWVMYAVPVPAAGQCSYDKYLERRDPVLGWPYPEEVPGRVWDASGVRPSPAFPDCRTPSRVSLYGDSFTQSECNDVEAWGNQLALRLGMRVANYGVGGYGTDQALLRYAGNRADTSDVVILAHMSADILRNLTRNRDLLSRQLDFAYKPRFVLDTRGELLQVSLPELTAVEHLRCIGATTPRLLLPHESFQPGGPAGVVEPEFPYTWSLLQSLGSFRMRARLAARPEWAEFYDAHHPLQGLQLTVAICRQFARVARDRGRTGIVLVLPGAGDLQVFRRTGRAVYADLVDAVRGEGTPCFEFGAALLQRLGTRAPGALFDATGHYRPEVDALLAEFVHDILEDLDLPR